MRYAMLINGVEAEWNEAPAAEIATAMSAIFAWFEKWSTAGKIANGGAELDSVTKAKTIRAGADGLPVVTDGPYLELKEVVGGVIMLEADSIDDAVAVAATWPHIKGSTSVEVRPTIEH